MPYVIFSDKWVNGVDINIPQNLGTELTIIRGTVPRMHTGHWVNVSAIYSSKI